VAWAWASSQPDALVESGIGQGIDAARLRAVGLLAARAHDQQAQLV